ncbi:hypothetical protein BATDEDRAFT_28980 [Batrachochytrium dendrobatidis JAM81]|uniref:Uncharacterized protein n=1 Tax=Batrachochytrium dendrobatidis (strain JAM81 / FGSC 10211) TaxID=684364 RepID=F4PFU2_BATDJ|nr:uncharacterized protein BATDEDRAFT_28980 [Batrachochytrium dendrobatidis JAM81]EGF75898.1 hypothetical protein BATDEDRAFT_28980 [Batrachochytrium dendrobatidis JAM81]|eukprot:XP_006683474.1 hypothetical protein BATDEDRAFT_28980 [Batrachochytrium dendrobatidis JAM81]
MAVVPPSENVQTPQSSQSPACRPGPSNGCQPTASNSDDEHMSASQVQKKYEGLQNRLENAKKIVKQKCDEYHKLKNELKSQQAIGRSGLTSGLAKLVPNPIKNKFGMCELIEERIRELKQAYGIGLVGKLYKFKKQFKN